MRSRCGTLLSALATATFVLGAGPAGAGAALRSEEELLYSVAFAQNWATQTWDDHGDLSDIGCRNTYTGMSHYAEYGYSYYYTLFGNLGLAQSKCGSEDETGLSDLRVGLRGRINRYLNTRGWEVVLTLPLSGQQIGKSRLGCGAFGIAGNVDRKDTLIEDRLKLGYGASVRLWEKPLAHEGRTEVELSGPLWRRLSWSAGVQHSFPLTQVERDPDGAAADCGTNAQSAKYAADLKYALSNDASMACGYNRAFWGEDTSRGQGMFCAYTYIWR